MFESNDFNWTQAPSEPNVEENFQSNPTSQRTEQQQSDTVDHSEVLEPDQRGDGLTSEPQGNIQPDLQANAGYNSINILLNQLEILKMRFKGATSNGTIMKVKNKPQQLCTHVAGHDHKLIQG